MANTTKENKETKPAEKAKTSAIKVKNPTKKDIRLVGKAGGVAIIKAGEERKLTAAFDEAAREEKALDLV